MAEFPALTLWTDAYLADTRHLTTLEHGAYLLLIMEAWRRPNCDLPDDDIILSRLCGLTIEQWASVKDAVLAFWKRDGRSKTWSQKRLSLERDRARVRSMSARGNAAKRWKKEENTDAPALPTQCQNDATTATATATATDIELVPKGTSPSDDGHAFTVSDFVESWNEVAASCGLPKIAKLTDARKRAFNVRRREYPDIEHWKAAFRCLHESKWMHGENNKGWRANPDFFLQAKSFTKLVEGAYGKTA